jgi:5-methylcytosine-specific restriction protein A
MAWTNSTRRARLPSNWQALRSATARRAKGKCEGITLAGEPRWHVASCDGTGTDCDHDVEGDDHSLSNLRWLSSPCHDHKTQAARKAARVVLRLPREAHPSGLPTQRK